MFLNKKRIHFIGIGGSGMNPLAKILIDMGYEVSGSDIKENVYTLRLKEMGAQIFYGHDESNIRLAEVVVISSAIKEDNIEYLMAKSNRMPIYKRAELLSFIMDKHENRIAVSGTHGKTTTTSFLSHYLQVEDKNPTFVIGAPLKHLNTASQFGTNEYIVAEADESDRSFLFLNPTVIVITNIEEEHLDEYEDLQDIIDTFSRFTDRLPPEKNCLIIHGDDENIKKINLKNKNVITYGLGENNIVQARNIRKKDQKIYFDVYIKGNLVAENICLNIPGMQNVLNSLVVFAFAYSHHLSLNNVTKSFLSFEGASRRFHKVGEVNEIEIYDDYAHHPTEIKYTLEAAKNFGKRVVAIFQPHRYSRYNAFYDKFAEVLDIADFVVVTNVYAAGESNSSNLSINNMLKLMNKNKTLYIKNIGDIGRTVMEIIKPGDLVITLGAGDITHVSKEIFQQLKAKNIEL
ncbi:MAG: UDP-N-acetylmuramate--L-alanine ligase [Candidatus Margulisbacteria bacterium]|nr:UDP-N-acetylmuramate--L-alanine ligase [Candidatus Margulisiibacteriota bacterium]